MRAALLSAPAASPSARATRPAVDSAAFLRTARMAALSSCAFGPGSQLICSALRACRDCQKWSATTTTPLAVMSTRRTPGIACAAVESTETALPPSTGLWASEAYSIPGNFTSTPNCALPSTFPGVSSRGSDLPIKRKSAFGLSLTSFGTGNRTAASASSPKLALWPRGPDTTPFLTRQSAGSTCHLLAAAAINMTRARAPARRNFSQASCRLLLVPVT